MRAPISCSTSVSSSASRNSSAAATDSFVSSWMLRPPIVTASTSGFSRAPPQAGHARKLMYSSIRSRICAESVSR